MYRYKNNNSDEKFDKYNNALELIDKIRDDEIKLSDVKNDQAIFKSNLGETKRENKKYQRSKRMLYTMLKCFIKQETRLLNFLMIIP